MCQTMLVTMLQFYKSRISQDYFALSFLPGKMMVQLPGRLFFPVEFAILSFCFIFCYPK